MPNGRSGKENRFFTELAEAMARFLNSSTRIMEYKREFAPLPRPAGLIFHLGVVLPTITDFSRSLAERNALMARFLEKHVLPAATSPLHSALQREEFESPETIFRAKGAMEEVPLPED